MLISKLKRLERQTEIEGKPKEQFAGSIKANFIDTEIFESALEDAAKVKDIISERDEEQPFFKKLSEDIFHSLYKSQPELYDKSDVYDSLKMEHDLITDIVDNKKFELLRGNTAGDIFNSTLSLNTFQEKAYEKIQEWVEKSEENKKMMDQMNDAISQQNSLQQMLDDLQYDPNNQDLQNQIEQAKQAIQQANQSLSQDQGNGNGMPGQNPANGMQGLKNSLQGVMNDVAKEVKDANDALNGFGMGAGSEDSGNPQRTPYDQKKALIEALTKSQKLKEVSKQLGRIKQSVQKVGKKPAKHGQTVCDIGAGNSIKRSLSTEKVKLIDRDLENDFFKRYMDKTLLEYKTQGMDEHKGPIVVCLDNSGSMSGNRDNWAKAVAVAMLQLAMKDKRDYRAIFFATRVVKVMDFLKGDMDNLTKMIELAEFWNGGGTRFEPALMSALESIEDSKFKKADILFITDGDPDNYLSEKFKNKFKAAKENKGFNVQSILIGGSNTEYLKEFSDNIITLKDLNKNDDLVNIFNKIQSVD